MRILLDTHYLIWLAVDADRITPAENALLGGSDTTLHISPVSIWELRLKWQGKDRHGARKGIFAPDSALEFIARGPLELMLLSGADCAASLSPPLDHRDPFDEMLLIHTQQLGGRLLTRDDKLLRHPLALQP